MRQVAQPIEKDFEGHGNEFELYSLRNVKPLIFFKAVKNNSLSIHSFAQQTLPKCS